MSEGIDKMKNTKLKLLSLILVLVLVFQSIGSMFAYAAGSRSISVYEVNGTVTNRKGGEEKKTNAFVGMRVNKGDIITTGIRSSAVLDLDGNKVVKLDAETEVTISDAKGEKGVDDKSVLSLGKGSVFSSVKEKLAENAEFKIITSNVVMGVRGTDYAMTIVPSLIDEKMQEVVIYVFTGMVYVDVYKFNGVNNVSLGTKEVKPYEMLYTETDSAGTNVVVKRIDNLDRATRVVLEGILSLGGVIEDWLLNMAKQQLDILNSQADSKTSSSNSQLSKENFNYGNPYTGTSLYNESAASGSGGTSGSNPYNSAAYNTGYVSGGGGNPPAPAPVGSAGNPIYLTSANFYDALSTAPAGTYFAIGSNLNLGTIPTIPNFAANLIGNGNTISGITAPLFENVASTALIDNLNVVSSISASGNTGVVAVNNYGTISNINTSGSISTTSGVASGVAAYNYSGNTIENCYSTASVTGPAEVGGLVAVNGPQGAVKNSYYSGSATSTGGNAGGIAGKNEGVIVNSYSTGSVSGASSSGGVVGVNTGTISSSYTLSNVSGAAARPFAGANSGSIGGCYYPLSRGTDSSATGLVDSAMSLRASYPSFNFSGTWTLDEVGNGYPMLTWQGGVNTTRVQEVDTLPDGPAALYVNLTGRNSGVPVSGAVIRIRKNDSLETKRATTSTTGSAMFIDIPYGTYTVEQASVPEGFVLNNQTQEVAITEQDPVKTVSMQSREIVYGNITVTTKDDGNPVSGVQLSLIKSGSNTASYTTSDSLGTAVFSNVPEGSYEVRVTSVPSGYILNSTPHTVVTTETEPNKTVAIEVVNRANVLGTLTVRTLEVTTNSPLVNSLVEIKDDSSNTTLRLRTDSTGTAAFTNIRVGTYSVREIQVPNSHYLNNDRQNVTLTVEGPNQAITIFNRRDNQQVDHPYNLKIDMWWDNPSSIDLDLHAYKDIHLGTNEHVYYSNKKYPSSDPENPEITVDPYMWYDFDHTSQPYRGITPNEGRPEVITVNRTESTKISVYVNNFNYSSSYLFTFNPIVYIYKYNPEGNEIIGEFELDRNILNGSGADRKRTVHVCDIELPSFTVTPVSSMEYLNSLP